MEPTLDPAVKSPAPTAPVGHHWPVPTRILTWNLQGRERPDLDVVAAAIASFGPDVVALQEVQRHQARALAERLGWTSAWRFKHWALAVPPEGLAVLAPTALVDVATVHLAQRWRWWSWRRRIAVRATVAGPEGPLAVVDTHLGAGVPETERTRQASRTIEVAVAVGSGALGTCIAGDLNSRPGSAVLGIYAAAGFRDAWSEVRPDEPGPTNWRRGLRDGPPTQRLDYVLVDPSLAVESAELPSAPAPGGVPWGALSDHLPVIVTVTPGDGGGGSRR